MKMCDGRLRRYFQVLPESLIKVVISQFFVNCIILFVLRFRFYFI